MSVHHAIENHATHTSRKHGRKVAAENGTVGDTNVLQPGQLPSFLAHLAALATKLQVLLLLHFFLLLLNLALCPLPLILNLVENLHHVPHHIRRAHKLQKLTMLLGAAHPIRLARRHRQWQAVGASNHFRFPHLRPHVPQQAREAVHRRYAVTNPARVKRQQLIVLFPPHVDDVPQLLAVAAEIQRAGHARAAGLRKNRAGKGRVGDGDCRGELGDGNGDGLGGAGVAVVEGQDEARALVSSVAWAVVQVGGRRNGVPVEVVGLFTRGSNGADQRGQLREWEPHSPFLTRKWIDVYEGKMRIDEITCAP